MLMILRNLTLTLFFFQMPLHAQEAEKAALAVEVAEVKPLPAMRFLSTVANDELFAILKAEPVFAALDKDWAGNPLSLIVTHTIRPTSGGQAAGFLTAVLSGSTLGLIPIVSNERLVLNYEISLNGKTVANYSFERKSTRATNLWSAGAGSALGKAGLEWAKSTALEVAAKVAKEPALAAVQDEIDFYFPTSGASGKQ